MNVLDLFSGIGGFSLGLERAGMRTVAFCEPEKYCHAVLQKHWPEVPIYEDVRTLSADRLASDGITVDVICGGFPCQDISIAGKGAGLAGERSGLWWQFHRLIEEIRPSWVIIENVSALRHNGLGDVLRSLAAVGYDAEWHCIPASAVGAPHRRDRIWIVAYPQSAGLQARSSDGMGVDDGSRRDSGQSPGASYQTIMAYSKCWAGEAFNEWSLLGKPYCEKTSAGHPNGGLSANGQWSFEPNVGRVAHGIPARVDRLKALGNAVVPQIPEIIGKWIMNYEPTRHDE